MITENNVVPLFGIPLCQTQIKPCEESEKFIKEKLDYELRSHKVSYISKDNLCLHRCGKFNSNNCPGTKISRCRKLSGF